MIFDPPNLSKRSTKSDSRAKVTKGLFIFSPKHGRMQKFTTFYQAGFENVQNFSIFTCMFSSGWGPSPSLKVLLCEKMHDHLGGRRGHCQVFASGQVFFIYRRDTSYLVVADCFVYSEFFFRRNNLLDHYYSSHNRILAFGIIRCPFEGQAL